MRISGARTVTHIATCVLAAAASAVLAQPAPVSPPVVKEGVTVKVSEHVYVIPDGKAPLVPNVGIVVGSKATLIVDPGLGLPSGQAVLREAAKVSKNAEVIIVNTHYHAEHVTGEAGFPPNTQIVRSAVQQKELEQLGMKQVAVFSSRTPEIADVLKDSTSFRAPTELFEREKTLDLGGVRVRLLLLGPGHTVGDTVIFVEGDRVLFSGDLAMKQLFPSFSTPQGSGRAWLASLDRMEAMQPRVVVGAHYPLTDASTIVAYRDYLKAVQARTVALKREGKSSDEAAKMLTTEFQAKYPDWEQPARITPAVAAFYREAE